MATRPTPESRDGSSSTRPASRSGGRPTTFNPRPGSSDASTRRPARASLSSSPSFDNGVPSFLRPTVSSTLRSTSPSPVSRPSTTSRPSSSKGSPSPAQSSASGRTTRPITPIRSPAQQPASSPRPITPKRSTVQPVNVPRTVAPAMDKGKAKSASTSRWSVASPRQLMQKASNAFKATKMRSKKNKDLAGPAASAVASVNKEASGAASGGIKAETARALPVQEEVSVEHHRPEKATEASGAASGGIKIETARALPLQEEASVEHHRPETATEASGAPSGEIKTETARAMPMEVQQHRQPETTTEAPQEEVITTTEAPLGVQEAVIVEPNAAQKSTEIKTEEDTGQVQQVSAEEPTGEAERGKAVVEENAIAEEPVEAVKVDARHMTAPEEKPQTVQVEDKVLPEEFAEAVNVDRPVSVPEEKAQTGAVEEPSEKEAEKTTENELPRAPVVEEPAKEPAVPLNVQDETATSTVKEEVVVETKAEETQHEVLPKPEKITENSQKSVMPEEVTKSSEKNVMPEEITEKSENSVTISEEPKEQPAAPEKQQEEVAAEEPKMIAASRASSLPATSLEEALEEMDATSKGQASTSRSEPVSPAKEAISKDKAVIDTVLSASAPTTPAKGDDAKKAGPTPLMARIPEEMRFSFKGSKVKTAMEKRPEEEQPKKKEVVRSNDVLEEAKGKLLEKKKSKVRALVGAFETVMDTPRASTPAGKSTPTPRGF